MGMNIKIMYIMKLIKKNKDESLYIYIICVKF